MNRLNVYSALIIGMITLVMPSLLMAADERDQGQYRRFGNRHFQDRQQYQHRSPQQNQGISGWFQKTFNNGRAENTDRRAQYRRSQFRYRDQESQYDRRSPRFLEVYGEYKGRRNRSQDDQSDDQDESSGPPQKILKETWASKLCEDGDSDEYKCLTVKRGQSWGKLFKDEDQRDLVRRLNRTNEELHTGQTIAVPADLEHTTLMDLAPMDKKIDTSGEKLILVDLTKMAWAAYGEDGRMVKWGPASGGQNYCPDMHRECTTIQGVFQVFEKKDQTCQSESFPIDRGGGSPMPYCMFFSKGFALHGSYELPGYNASHGCVRMYKVDAEWLNHEFVHLPDSPSDRGTKVIVRTTELPTDTKTFKLREPDEYKDTTKLDEGHDYYREEGVSVSNVEPSREKFNLPKPENVKETRNVERENDRHKMSDVDDDVLQYDEERRAFTHDRHPDIQPVKDEVEEY